jgi:tungstate transport system substrate-binding protein
MTDVQGALGQSAGTGVLFASRGDDSGTYRKEVALRSDTGADPTTASRAWYRQARSGTGATLNAGNGMGAYVMTDRATRITLEILFEGDQDLFNPYGVIPIRERVAGRREENLENARIGTLRPHIPSSDLRDSRYA